MKKEKLLPKTSINNVTVALIIRNEVSVSCRRINYLINHLKECKKSEDLNRLICMIIAEIVYSIAVIHTFFDYLKVAITNQLSISNEIKLLNP